MEGTILKGIGGFYYVREAQGNVYTLRAQAKIRRAHIKPMVGDRVLFQPGSGEAEGWLTEILPRRNFLKRPPVANIDLIVVTVAAAAPDPDLLLVDRLMLAARQCGIAVKLVVTKAELNPASAADILRQYAGADAAPIQVSAVTGAGIDALRTALRGQIYALAGQSGAGKSTLINALNGLTLETGRISEKIERGRHTTRHSELILLADDTMVLDTPGFSLLETDLAAPETLAEFYPEFQPYDGSCRFRPCMHHTEPGCAVRDAVTAEKIHAARYARYVVLLDEMQKKWSERYG